MKVNEIFYSLQGESSHAGYPCVFVRLAGCNLRCSYCDTRYAFNDGEEMAIDDILARVVAYKCPLVEVTGGEPLIQKETPSLISRLLEMGFEVLMETNGSQDISIVDNRVSRIVDIKCPSSGMAQSNDFDNLGRMTPIDELKFVIGDRTDYEYAREILEISGHKFPPKSPIHFSPEYGKMDPALLAEWILEDHLLVRLHLQLHKVIWPYDKRGV